MASRASLILLLTATLTASGLAAAHKGPEPGRPWPCGPAAVAEGGGFLPVGKYQQHHRHHLYYRRDRYPYSYYQPYPQPGYGAPHWRAVPPGYPFYPPAYEARPHYGPPRHW